MKHLEKIDFVIIWVDGNDPEWQKEKNSFSPTANDNKEVRFRDWDNLRYWFRGIEKFAPWVNNIYFVTWGHIPDWLDTSNPKLHIVNHRDYIPEEYLPTFNSHTIELNLHRIKGLSEQFVYFNDDMFITAPVKPEDFFIGGKPMDTYSLDCICFTHMSAGAYNGNNIEIINSHFSKKQCMKKDFSKWFSPRNGLKRLIKTTALNMWPWFTGMYYNHLPGNYLKNTFEEVWNSEQDFLDATCRDRFRSKLNCNQWVMKYWQLAQGICVPRSTKIGHCFHLDDEKVFSDAKSAVSGGRYKLICLNDTDKTDNFEEKKKEFIRCFEKLLPDKSNFEL